MIIVLIILLLFAVPSPADAQVVNKSQLIKSTHWVYDSLAALEAETKRPMFVETAPITVGEIEFYFKEIDRESLSESGKATYDEVDNFLHSKPIGFFKEDFGLAVNPYFNPELYYKSNPNIPWSFNYFYKDNLATLPIKVGISNYFTGEIEVFLGKNYDASANAHNAFCNVPLDFGDTEFSQPTWAYGSAAITCENWGASIVAAREGFRIGRTLLGSVIYNNTFETQSFVQLNVYSPYFKYNLDAVQVNTNKYVYLHQFEMQFFERIKFTFIEGTLINGPFEFKNLNPFMVMHSFGLWMEGWSDDKLSAQYMAFLLEVCPISNWKIYALMSQNEITMPYEANTGNPTSIGLQLGSDFYIPSQYSGRWFGTVEAIWTMPYLYIKATESNSLYSNRPHPHGTISYMKSWMGSPYGPDCLGFAFEFGYKMHHQWSAKIGYSLIAHGENGFNTFEKEDYYPNIRYHKYKSSDPQKAKEALDDAAYLFPHGMVEFTQRVTLSGSYYLNKYAQFNGQAVFTHIINCGNIKDNSQTGIELALSVKCEPF